MATVCPSPLAVEARVEEVMPSLGLAYVVDDASTAWGVTRAMPHHQFDPLQPGRRVRLELRQHPRGSLVHTYRLLD